MPIKVLISGVNGQDGILLSEQVINKDVEVFGIGYQQSASPFLDKKVHYSSCDIRDVDKVISICNKENIDYFFNLASVSSVSRSFLEPELTREVNFLAPKEIIKRYFSGGMKNRKFFQASSSEMFGNAAVAPQDEATALNPLSPYAESKAEMFIECMRIKDDGNFVANSIMYNHESHLRPDNFLSKKVAKAVAEFFVKGSSVLTLGNLGSERDWGYAGDHISSAWMMMDLESPEEFVIATGKSHSVLDMVKLALQSVELDGMEFELIKVDPSLLRPREAASLVGNSAKAERLLGWKPKTDLLQLMEYMVNFEIENFEV